MDAVAEILKLRADEGVSGVGGVHVQPDAFLAAHLVTDDNGDVSIWSYMLHFSCMHTGDGL